MGLSALVMLLTALLNGIDARAAYVLYMRSYGEWSVVCSRDEPTGRQSCILGAPAPTMSPPASGIRARIEVSADDEDRPGVRLFIHHVLDTDRPVTLGIDDRDPFSARATRGGETAWRGQMAAQIVGQMATGRSLIVRFFEPGLETASERFFSLADFANAFADYRRAESRLRKNGP